ncbi:hypothetical protein [Chitiniphilus eburneus]|uniref:Uncharacterized protein n=1 Tax=Chitiniphilus eburneus TaxID=2571148 RepID=A0A4U0QN39_9NEIS|nr:hypothetical protein [Chitiniphilus eburneus]TJZ77534.1 hypothetical protein FAZ21_04175 [Chitiniphilus eburneus]
MAAYHQVGYNSESIILEQDLDAFRGVILSPVNYAPEETTKQAAQYRNRHRHDTLIFDPQLYLPRSERGALARWPYFPADMDTSDHSDLAWWDQINKLLISSLQHIDLDSICSPAPHPRVFNDDYYARLVAIANSLHAQLGDGKPKAMLTAHVGMQDLASPMRYMAVATLMSRFKGRDIYLTLCDDTKPRRERTNTAELEGAARLIRVLSSIGYQVTVAFSSTEMILWKAAGATNNAAGKYFNLRRFSLSRWEEEKTTGGAAALPYWLEPSLLAFLREADLLRFQREFVISSCHDNNPYSQKILAALSNTRKQPAWSALAQQQFLFWFANCEASVTSLDEADRLLGAAAVQWEAIRNAKLKFEEELNDGRWIQPWRVVLNQLAKKAD